MRERMKEDENNDVRKIISYGCSAHYINLVAHQITPNSILKHVVTVQKFFRNHHQPHVSLVTL